MQNIEPKQISIARKLNRLSMAQLSARMGDLSVSKMAISKIERGLIRPSLETLRAIAEACNVSVDFFYKKDISVSSMDFRIGKDVSAKKAEQIQSQIISEIQRYFELDSYDLSPVKFVNPMKGVTLRNYSDAEEAAMKLREKWNLGLQPIFSVYELIQNYGIHIIEVDIEDADIDGISTYVNGNIPVIVINTYKNITTERKRFTALHELAHLIFNIKPLPADEFEDSLCELPKLPYVVTQKPPNIETLCNNFSNAMLVPKQCFYRRIGTIRKAVDMEELVSMRNMYGISIAAIVHRLHDLRIIDDSYYNKCFDESIKQNKLEVGWGEFPIKEKADREVLMKIRLEKEIK